MIDKIVDTLFRSFPFGRVLYCENMKIMFESELRYTMRGVNERTAHTSHQTFSQNLWMLLRTGPKMQSLDCCILLFLTTKLFNKHMLKSLISVTYHWIGLLSTTIENLFPKFSNNYSVFLSICKWRKKYLNA